MPKVSEVDWEACLMELERRAAYMAEVKQARLNKPPSNYLATAAQSFNFFREVRAEASSFGLSDAVLGEDGRYLVGSQVEKVLKR